MATERNVVDFKIHNLTEEQFQELKAQGKIDPNAVYCTPDESLKRNQITNCITEIPQDVKLELNNGALTLKAGSKVYVPNGINNFEVVQIIENKTKTETVDGKYYLVLNPSDGYLNRGSYPSTSGTTAPTTVTTGTVWYDTENNRVKRYSGGTWSNMSLPLCVYTVSGGSIVSIDQVFNGFGYMGSTVFVLPGVKGLIPNGRNEDGTLKNTEFITDHVSTVTNASNLTMDLWYAISANGDIANSLTDYWKYDEQKNAWLHDGVSWGANMPFARSYANGGKVENFVSKHAFHAVDYSDFENTVEELDNSVVHNTGDETITGIKSFRELRFRNDVPVSKDITTATETALVQTTTNTAGGVDGASIIRYVYANGNREVRYRAGFSKRNSSGNLWPGIRVGVDANDNNYYKLDIDPVASSNGTDIATTAWVRDLFETLYPVGAIYIGTQSSCPMASIVKKSDGSNSTWELVAAGKALWTGNGTTGDGTVRNTPNTGANNTISAGLPNITGTASVASDKNVANGVFAWNDERYATNGGGQGGQWGLTFNASRSSSIYGNSTTVQPPAYVVNVWRRTA